jgi:hypothetical protein
MTISNSLDKTERSRFCGALAPIGYHDTYLPDMSSKERDVSSTAAVTCQLPLTTPLASTRIRAGSLLQQLCRVSCTLCSRKTHSVVAASVLLLKKTCRTTCRFHVARRSTMYSIRNFGIWGKRIKVFDVPQGPRLGDNPWLRMIHLPI